MATYYLYIDDIIADGLRLYLYLLRNNTVALLNSHLLLCCDLFDNVILNHLLNYLIITLRLDVTAIRLLRMKSSLLNVVYLPRLRIYQTLRRLSRTL